MRWKETNLHHFQIWECPTEVKIYNSQVNRLTEDQLVVTL